jgi:hypothetical protein
MMNEHDLDIALTMYADHLKADYVNWWGDRKDEAFVRQMIIDRDYTFDRGRNYLKVVTSERGNKRSVHSFIVIKPTKGFKFGDILKPAGWNAPATNFARGNVLEPKTYSERALWAGVV